MNNIFLSKHFLISYKITYNRFVFLLCLKKKILYNNLNRNFLKNLLFKFFNLNYLNFYGYIIVIKLKKFYDKNKYFNIKKYFNKIFLIEIFLLFKKLKNFLKK